MGQIKNIKLHIVTDIKFVQINMKLGQILLGATRRVLTGKDGGRKSYKGRGVRNVGVPDKYGGYRIIPKKIQKLVVPDLTDCELKPYVSNSVEEEPIVLQEIRENIEDIPDSFKEIP